MTIGWLRILVVICVLLGMLVLSQVGVETIYSGPFVVSVAVVCSGFVEVHRRTLQRIDVLEAAIDALSQAATKEHAAGDASHRS
tara:strand:+ start:19532 stop:19783 length:252 start_codon:yes stop_codon:yes gene_type:complete